MTFRKLVSTVLVAVMGETMTAGFGQSGLFAQNEHPSDNSAARTGMMRHNPIPVSAEITTIMKLIEKSDFTAAQKKIDGILKKDARNLQGRFLQGVVLARRGKIKQAIEVFEAITEAYPERPEPYNNLAVLYAANRQYEKARDTLLKAIKTNSSYATVYQNLSDIYGIMAGMAYNKALDLWKKDEVPANALALIITLPEGPSEPVLMAEALPAEDRTSEPMKQTLASFPEEPPVMSDARVTSPISADPASSIGDSVSITAMTAAVATEPEPMPEKVPVWVTEAPKPSLPVSKPDPRRIDDTIIAWAKAWAAQDVEAYLSFYSSEYRPSDRTRPEWEEERRQRISAPSFIRVAVSGIKVLSVDGATAVVRFRQNYRSNTFRGNTNKKFQLKHEGADWKIVEEANVR